MAKLYISEYARMAEGGSHPQMADEASWIRDQDPVAIGVGSIQSLEITLGTRVVRLHTDAICSFTSGTDPIATINNKRMAANQTEYFYIKDNIASPFKFAVIANT